MSYENYINQISLESSGHKKYFGDFGGIALNLEKVGQTPCPSLPFFAIDDRKKFP